MARHTGISILFILTTAIASLAEESGNASSRSIIPTEVYRVSVDQHDRPVVLLHDPEGERYLPIWIGPCEANAITRKLNETKFSRPLTHDLFTIVMETTGTKLTHILVDQIRQIDKQDDGGVFFAILTVERPDGTVHRIDSRSSDAIALAVRMNLPVFVALEILEDNGISDLGDRKDPTKDSSTTKKTPKGFY